MSLTVSIISWINVAIASFLICLQFSTYLIWEDRNGRHVYYPWDRASSGIWGGLIILTTALLILAKKLSNKTTVRSLTGLSSLCGLVMVGLYSWALNWYVSEYGIYHYTNHMTCKDIKHDFKFQSCTFQTYASLFVSLGSITALLNGYLMIFQAKKIANMAS